MIISLPRHLSAKLTKNKLQDGMPKKTSSEFIDSRNADEQRAVFTRLKDYSLQISLPALTPSTSKTTKRDNESC